MLLAKGLSLQFRSGLCGRWLSRLFHWRHPRIHWSATLAAVEYIHRRKSPLWSPGRDTSPPRQPIRCVDSHTPTLTCAGCIAGCLAACNSLRLRHLDEERRHCQPAPLDELPQSRVLRAVLCRCDGSTMVLEVLFLILSAASALAQLCRSRLTVD